MTMKDVLASTDLGLFADVCRIFFSQMGFDAKETAFGVGPNLSRVHMLYSKQTQDPLSLFQCHDGKSLLDVEMMSSFKDVMNSVNMTRGYFITAGVFPEEIQNYVAANGIKPLDIDGLIELISKMSDESQRLILEIASQGGAAAGHKNRDEVPECAKCGFKMLLMVTEGKYREGMYWECPNPNCRYIAAVSEGGVACYP